eukprot:CAMPEP_0113670366 /NCGR_PEP_ID=MMETSP0038_2-20120614/5098_1 /TAXON_ID=2898 /ORGANISM="Cryptomonas paramecium" /LENGTH=132 /DNA_ID=CAMNT_0000586377 /DNA_START=121 /DNA_END=516 /DNA_ORIENTATION=+ /assembly_acc=CAM_ASM_000170
MPTWLGTMAPAAQPWTQPSFPMVNQNFNGIPNSVSFQSQPFQNEFKPFINSQTLQTQFVRSDIQSQMQSNFSPNAQVVQSQPRTIRSDVFQSPGNTSSGTTSMFPSFNSSQSSTPSTFPGLSSLLPTRWMQS